MSKYGSMNETTSLNSNTATDSIDLSPEHDKIREEFRFHHNFSVFTPQRPAQRVPSKEKIFDASVFNSQDSDDCGNEEDHLSLLDPYFDLTRTRLKRYFDQVDANRNGSLSYEEFRSCLGELGIVCQDDNSFKLLVDKFHNNKQTSGISYQEFENAVQMIKLADLFKPEHIASLCHDNRIVPSTLTCFDYSAQKLRSQVPVQNLQSFFYSKKPKWAVVRWINMEGISELNMKRLAVYYRLHPLALEDTLSSERHRPKFDTFDHHHFLILPVVISANAAKTCPLRRRQSLMRSSTGQPLNSIRSFTSTNMDHPEDITISSHAPANVTIEVQQLSFFILEDTVITVQEDSTKIWSSLHKRLEASYSKVRHNGAFFLVYSLLDAIVDDIAPIMNGFGEVLEEYEKELKIQACSYNIEKVEKMKCQIHAFIRAVKPMREVVSNLLHSDVIKDLPKMYLRDVFDHLLQILEDGEENLELCERMTDRYTSLRSDRQNDVMYHLTIVAAMFIPAQFLTGVFGMNFQYMPELHWKYSYFFFWVIIMIFFCCLFYYFHYRKKWI